MAPAYRKTTGSIKPGSSFLTLPTRAITGRQIMPSDGWTAGLPIAGGGTPKILSGGWSLGRLSLDGSRGSVVAVGCQFR